MPKRTPKPERDPFARRLDYRREETSFGYYHLLIRGLTPEERDAILAAIPRLIGAALTGEDGDYEVSERGRQPGATTYPKETVRDKLKESRDLQSQAISRPARAARLGVPLSTLRYWEEQAEKNPNYPF